MIEAKICYFLTKPLDRLQQVFRFSWIIQWNGNIFADGRNVNIVSSYENLQATLESIRQDILGRVCQMATLLFRGTMGKEKGQFPDISTRQVNDHTLERNSLDECIEEFWKIIKPKSIRVCDCGFILEGEHKHDIATCVKFYNDKQEKIRKMKEEFEASKKLKCAYCGKMVNDMPAPYQCKECVGKQLKKESQAYWDSVGQPNTIFACWCGICSTTYPSNLNHVCEKEQLKPGDCPPHVFEEGKTPVAHGLANLVVSKLIETKEFKEIKAAITAQIKVVDDLDVSGKPESVHKEIFEHLSKHDFIAISKQGNSYHIHEARENFDLNEVVVALEMMKAKILNGKL